MFKLITSMMILSLLISTATLYAEYDPEEVLQIATILSDRPENEEQLWRHYLMDYDHPDIKMVRSYIRQCAARYNVPAELLEAVAYLENNFIQMGPTVDQGWGMMHLVENDYCDTLGKAAELIGVTRQEIKDNWMHNVRGAAALLSHYADDSGSYRTLTDWFSPLMKLTGLRTEDLQAYQAKRYFDVLKDGVKEISLLNQEVVFEARNDINTKGISDILRNLEIKRTAGQRVEPDWPGAEARFTKYNHLKGRVHPVDTWVIHYIAQGTAAGAASWFNNPDARACAHFIISKEGKVIQCVKVKDTAWHCTKKTQPKGGMNNPRSIGIEHEVTVSHPEWWHSKPLLKVSGKMAKHFMEKLKIPYRYGCPGFVGHKNMLGCSTSCPGNFPWKKWWKHAFGTEQVNYENHPYKPLHHEATVCKMNVSLRQSASTESTKLAVMNKGDTFVIKGQYKEWFYGEFIPKPQPDPDPEPEPDPIPDPQQNNNPFPNINIPNPFINGDGVNLFRDHKVRGKHGYVYFSLIEYESY